MEEPPIERIQQSRWALALASFGLMADMYDFTIINLVRPSLEARFGGLSAAEDGVLTSAALVGAIAGQISFGALADVFGRRAVFILTASIVCIGSVGSACTEEITFGVHVYTALAIWRFFIGIGIGGEYPLAAATTMENVASKSSGQALAITFSGMAAGCLLGPIVVIALTSGFAVDPVNVWRPAFAFGGILAAFTVVLRVVFLEETPAFQHATRRSELHSGTEDAAGPLQALCYMRWSLAGTAGSWFLYDIITYGIGLFSTTIFATRPGLESAKVTLFIALVCLPGILTSIVLTKFIRMQSLQFWGLGGMLLCFSILAGVHEEGPHQESTSRYWIALIVFAVMRSIDAAGPGVATFSVPGQIFPTQIRGTAHGISAAMGKLGAVVGTLLFPLLNEAFGIKAIMSFMSGMCVLTMVWTRWFTPSYGPAELDEIAKLDTGMPAERQAELAERVLFRTTESKAMSAAICDL